MGCNDYQKISDRCGYVKSACRMWPLPMDSGGDVGIAATVDVENNVQYTYIPEQFQVADVTADAPFIINSIEIGTRNQTAGSGPLESSMFRVTNQQNIMNFTPMRPVQTALMNVTNDNAAVQPFRGAFTGRMLECPD